MRFAGASNRCPLEKFHRQKGEIFLGWQPLMGIITTKKAAELLRISPVRVRQLIQRGQLVSEKAGRDHLLQETEVKRFDREGRLPRGRPKKNRGR